MKANPQAAETASKANAPLGQVKALNTDKTSGWQDLRPEAIAQRQLRNEINRSLVDKRLEKSVVTPQQEMAKGALQPQKAPGMYVTNQEANLREEESPYSVITTLPQGEILDAIHHENSNFKAGLKTNEHTWVGNHSGQKGWVEDSKLSLGQANNSKTGRGFNISHGAGEIRATQTGGDDGSAHSAYLEYNVEGEGDERTFVLSHIISTPEIGSGLGSLLVYHFARLAKMQGVGTINIDMAAPKAIGFYEHMGWRAKQNTDDREAGYLQSDDLLELLKDRDQDHRAKLEYIKEGHSTEEWQDLGEEGQQAYLDMVRGADEELDEEGVANMNRRLVHEKAVSEVGLTATTQTILTNALASVKRSW